MQVDSNIFKVIPENLGLGFGFCVYGEVTSEVMDLANTLNLKMQQGEKYINFFPTEKTDFEKMFPESKKFKYMDGFSPNLNKHLHIGHFSNLILAKAFQSMNTSEQYISILGDTVIGEVPKEDALKKFKENCEKFYYKVDRILFASEMKYSGSLLIDGIGDYEGTKVVEVGDDKIVVIKSDGSTSYFYQDMALASMLNDETLYLTGYEQENHFNILKKLFPHVNHVGLGLVKYQTSKLSEAGKMSTRLGNVIYLSDLMNDLMKEFDGNEKLCYNIFAGYILKNHPKSDKVFNIDTIKNPKNSPGLYLSYTMARLKSAGIDVIEQSEFNKQELKFNFIKSKAMLSPTYLFNSLVDLCKEINNLYVVHKIVNNEKNKQMFQLLLGDLALGMKKIGMFEVDRV